MRELAILQNGRNAIPVYLVPGGKRLRLPAGVDVRARKWVRATGFSARRGSLCLVPQDTDSIACALFGLGENPHPMEAGTLARSLPPGNWRLEVGSADPFLANLGFLLGGYRFDRFRSQNRDLPRIFLPESVDRQKIRLQCESVFLVRDLINRPTNDLGPAELEEEIRVLAKEFDARVAAIRGDDLIRKNFPMIHAVGRASSSPPRLVDMKWGRPDHPRVTLVGKGVCFDTGGLNLKPGDSMALMKKDMGGAANVLGLARMIMASRLPVRLRVLVAAVENAVSGNAFRPGDILRSRKGLTVEIGNTDAEGRLVLADALSLGDDEKPEMMIDMATLTGAARVALGPDLPALFTPDDEFARDVADAGNRLADPSWRMPLWEAYRTNLSSQVADVNHIAKGPFAGAVTAALFLQRFVEKTPTWAHFDVFGWVSTQKPWAPVGGEAHCIRAVFDVLANRFPVR